VQNHKIVDKQQVNLVNGKKRITPFFWNGSDNNLQNNQNNGIESNVNIPNLNLNNNIISSNMNMNMPQINHPHFNNQLPNSNLNPLKVPLSCIQGDIFNRPIPSTSNNFASALTQMTLSSKINTPKAMHRQPVQSEKSKVTVKLTNTIE